jgi:antitoxin CptB
MGYAEHKLRWKCRRGLLELDIVLQRLLQKESLQGEDLKGLENLLDLPDNDLWDIVIGRSNDYEPQLNDIVARLRAA